MEVLLDEISVFLMDFKILQRGIMSFDYLQAFRSFGWSSKKQKLFFWTSANLPGFLNACA